MNLIGKLFVVLIAVMSIMFMGAAIAVFSTHKDWKSTVDSQKAQIAELNTELEQLEGEYKLAESNLRLDIDSAEQQILKLERERAALVTRNEKLYAANQDLMQERRETTDSIASTQATSEQLADGNDKLRDGIAAAQAATEVAFEKAIDATSELHEAKVKLEIELERNAQLLEQVEGNG